MKLINVILASLLFVLSGLAVAQNYPYGGYEYPSNPYTPNTTPNPYGNYVNPHSPDSSVNGYTRRDGTYVAPYQRTAPNDTQRDNYSSKPNVNPYNGTRGTITPKK